MTDHRALWSSFSIHDICHGIFFIPQCFHSLLGTLALCASRHFGRDSRRSKGGDLGDVSSLSNVQKPSLYIKGDKEVLVLLPVVTQSLPPPILPPTYPTHFPTPTLNIGPVQPQTFYINPFLLGLFSLGTCMISISIYARVNTTILGCFK